MSIKLRKNKTLSSNSNKSNKEATKGKKGADRVTRGATKIRFDFLRRRPT